MVCMQRCFEETICNFTVKLRNRSSQLGTQVKESIHYGSLACSHLNQWLVAVLTGATCDDPEMADDGRMSADKARGKQAELQQALDQGLKWTVVKAEAVKRWPILTKLIQEARQIAGHIHDGETHFELLESI